MQMGHKKTQTQLPSPLSKPQYKRSSTSPRLTFVDEVEQRVSKLPPAEHSEAEINAKSVIEKSDDKKKATETNVEISSIKKSASDSQLKNENQTEAKDSVGLEQEQDGSGCILS